MNLRLSDIFNYIKLKTIGFVMMAFGLFLLIAVLTYNPQDPSFDYANDNQVQNMAGTFGAYIIDPMLQAFGYSLVFPVLILVTAGGKLILGLDVQLIILRIAAMLLLMLPSAVFFSIFGTLDGSILKSYGGYVGLFVHSELIEHIPATVVKYTSSVFTVINLCLCCSISISNLRRFIRNAAKIIVLLASYIVKLTALIYITVSFVASKIIGRKYNTERAEDYEEGEEAEYSVSDFTNDGFIKRMAIGSNKDDLKTIAKRIMLQPALSLDPGNYSLPHVSLLKEAPPSIRRHELSDDSLSQNAKILHQVLQDFGVNGNISCIHPGPVVTLYELEPAAGTKSSRVIGLADDIARSMSAISARIAVIPGKNAIGIELPNTHRETVFLRDILESAAYKNMSEGLPLILGKDIGGTPIVADLAKMPHLLVAGTTGSGKSVAINTMILSLLYKYTANECQFIMIDPKMLELSAYQDIPHLLAPVVTDPRKAVSALKWVVKEMEQRYRAMSMIGVRNVNNYNKVIEEAQQKGPNLEKQVQVGFDKDTGHPIFEFLSIPAEKLPYIVVIVDEMADLMLVAGKEIEASIQRLAQMARAAGIHIIMATQRPSVDVITGVIKANFPTRISFQVTSKIDSRTIINEQGAEQLLGMGDMLYMAGGGKIMRVHGPFVADNEVEAVATYLKSQGAPRYRNEITDDVNAEIIQSDANGSSGNYGNSSGDLYSQAVDIVINERKATTSYIQRRLSIGYNKAATLIEQMEKEGIISAPNRVGKREILIEGGESEDD